MVPWERVAVCVKAMATGFYAPYAGSRICTYFILPSWGPSWELSNRGPAHYALESKSVALDFRLRFCFSPRVARSAASLRSIPLYPSCSTIVLFCSILHRLRRVALFCPGDVLKNNTTFNTPQTGHRTTTPHLAIGPVYGLNLPVSRPRFTVYWPHKAGERTSVDPCWS